MIQGRHYAHVALAQSFRTILLPAPRASIFDGSGRLLAATEGRLGVTADAATLGRFDSRGRWRPTPAGRAELRRLARLARVPAWKLIGRVRRRIRRSPYAPAVGLQSANRAPAPYLEERAPSLPGLHGVGAGQPL